MRKLRKGKGFFGVKNYRKFRFAPVSASMYAMEEDVRGGGDRYAPNNIYPCQFSNLFRTFPPDVNFLKVEGAELSKEATALGFPGISSNNIY